MSTLDATCPWCSAPRAQGPDCPRCGANYAKAAAIKAHGRAVADPVPVRIEAVPDAVLAAEAEAAVPWKEVDDPELERKFCLAAIPAALVLALVFHASGLGAMLQRMAMTMPVHELGHAVTAWFCGYTAIPTLWKTLTPETRGFVAPLALAGGLGYLMFRARAAANFPLLAAGAALLVLQAGLTFGTGERTARMLITFGGDGAGMILACLLMASFFFGKDTQLYKGWLRWGFLVIGAAAFVDIYATWWKGRADMGAVPFGEMEGIKSDPLTLYEDYGWPIRTLINRYFFLGIACLAGLAAVYAWGVREAGRIADIRRGMARPPAA